MHNTWVANSLVGKRTRTLGDLPYPVFRVAFPGPFIKDSKMGNTKANVLPCTKCKGCKDLVLDT